MDRPIRNGAGWLALCPVHGDRKPSLSIHDGDDGKIFIKCFGGCSFVDLREELQGRGLWEGDSSNRPAPPKAQPILDRSRLLDRLWNGAHPVGQASVVSRYLAVRGIELNDWPQDLREHPALVVYEDGKRTNKTYPAMLAAIRNMEGRPAGLHITFIKSDGSGKAPIDSPRKIIGLKEGSTRGGTVRLMEPIDGVIGIAEGLETALSAYLLTNTPVWSCLNSGGLERAILPGDIKRVIVFADRDCAGLKAAANACERFRREGRECEIMAPDGWKQDFNDILQKENAHPVAS